ncbi:MAG: reverse transcriptase domain-containing protein [Thermoanaerobaculia bacterium]
MTIAATKDELLLAWKRVRRDTKDRHFTVHPDLTAWIESDLDRWLDGLVAELAAGYTPRPSRFIAVPKAGNLIRPGTLLEVEDALIYNFLVGRILPAVIEHLRSWQEPPDTAYPLADIANSVSWTETGFLVWRKWRERSLAALARPGVEYVVVTDITGFYENIDLQRLGYDVRALAADDELVDLLQRCLRNWALPRNEGIPQGYSASDILAKLYLDGVDRNLLTDTFQHVRYVDDIRIFCRAKLEARKAIRRLTAHLYPRGLNLQSAKTHILDKRAARRKFDGVDEIIADLNKKIAQELIESGGEYVAPDEVLKALSEHPGPAPEVLERAFFDHFAHGGSAAFDPTLFHYLLVRLGKVNSRVAVPYALDLLGTRPEETGNILGYLTAVGLEPHEQARVLGYVGSEEAIFDYQVYQVLRWFWEQRVSNTTLLNFCRAWVADQNRDQALRSYAFAYLRDFGTPTDWAQIEESYGEAATDIDRADRIAAVERLERGRRNAFYARVEGHGRLAGRAVAVSKGRTAAV